MRIIVSGGGTGGHIYPALALIRTIKAKHPNTECLYIGTEKGLESKLVPRENIPFKAIHITGFKRSLSIENVKTVLRFIKGVKQCKKMIKEFKPDVVIGTGGYVCGPVVYAAAKLKVPTIIHEQNSVPGLTNKFLSRYVNKVAVCFDSAKDFFDHKKVVLTGNPRASEVLGQRDKKVLQTFHLKENIPTVLIFGGSRGARPINEAVIKALANFVGKSYQVIYATGDVHYEAVQKEISLIGQVDNVSVVPFIHNMPEVLRAVDLVVARAGATTLAELTALGVPSILIPSPYVTNNHQEKNARALTEKHAALMLLEKDLTATKLIETIDQILLDKDQTIKMREAARKLGIPDASERLYQVMESLAESRS
ncbi:undecaprenyldiphospho-muramoylpentapeptide beta-N-acetylglucosaminyltransferase [Heyndrickxia ginsengihumi]|uniref:UDP-N-acetylglucosamine--N-acetylmuramyl-(pentapeptide) pyrophosphoryl-undecaprenol N-acetylglucosamine transferase n=1 Tax=Heyndrickxia ginsengihumi TaxID=363870 RepID=A0A0A6VAP3_9BACI|nr:undecaprenyldiphospho-muramoylpentapeptide beta-N-acetylglucosaminyltransferase [Heyndrickxia ginsengihumi]KHD84676.1 UDP-diphospho-muramoylpentapeptide beta-N-acetylglucosaminyltransferase [Heyndrickxia ginsengihumi]MBE6183423.1 undecaprenyldiphospho-muramoylpentapeptide beta-N-acetylglucosaminyltransferase [Bacillus sp. (in: firmicutes)]MCM3022406.1 undecaprenyldiphospho-muramoylpentapeptide beta-N-acetylglucosaminyltransferase [Heyndrickxia ginsengihumi]NEY18651.1 undecaprenyldiphospho-mu